MTLSGKVLADIDSMSHDSASVRMRLAAVCVEVLHLLVTIWLSSVNLSQMTFSTQS